MTNEEYAWLSDKLAEEKQKFSSEDPDFVPDDDFWDEHSCSMFADENGYCQWCGEVVYGSCAYHELYGGECGE